MRSERAAAAAGLGALAWWCAPAAAPVCPPVAALAGLRCRLAGRRGIAITFDDGPHAQGTPAVLEHLYRAGARATFFLVGEQVERRRGLAAEIAAAGHEIGIHGYRHTLLLRRRPGAVRDDLARAADVIGEATGRAAVWYRPPYGVLGSASLRIAQARWDTLLWSRWGRDWEARATPASIVRNATRALGARDVVLLHDSDAYSSSGSWQKTAAAVPFVIEAAQAAGEPLVTADGWS